MEMRMGMGMEVSLDRMDVNGFPVKVAQCRICHDEDQPSNMEAPCACCGSLKQFRPGYAVPPPRLPFVVTPVPLREPWEFADNHYNNHPSIIAAENFFDHGFDDYTASTASIICCRIITIIFMILVVLRHTIPIVYNGAGEYSFALYTLLMMRTIAILLPMFVMLKACSIIRHHRRHRQAPAAYHHATSDEENEIVQTQVSAHFIHIQ